MLRDEKPSPDYWADAPQHSPQLIDLSFVTISFRHGTSLRWCTAHPQLPVTLERQGFLRLGKMPEPTTQGR